MELSPNDIRNFEFGTHMRGYDKEAVDNFKEQVALSLEMLKQENLKLSMEAESLKVQLAGLKQFEDAIKNAAIDARRNADMTVANAKKEAELLLSRAASEASQALASRAQRRDELEAEITKLELTRRSYLTKLRALISSHQEWVEELARAEALSGAQQHTARQVADDSIEITQTSEFAGNRRETVATQPSQAQPIHLEEANEAKQIIPVTADSEKSDMAALKSAIQDEPKPEAPVDPELAAALENYQRLAESKAKVDPSSTGPILRPSPKFVTSNGNALPADLLSPQIRSDEVSESTDRVKTAPSLEPNRLNPDPQPKQGNGDDLANVLDNVVHKFEEEMDKAAKS
jgi:cell division initiation protein